MATAITRKKVENVFLKWTSLLLAPIIKLFLLRAFCRVLATRTISVIVAMVVQNLFACLLFLLVFRDIKHLRNPDVIYSKIMVSWGPARIFAFNICLWIVSMCFAATSGALIYKRCGLLGDLLRAKLWRKEFSEAQQIEIDEVTPLFSFKKSLQFSNLINKDHDLPHNLDDSVSAGVSTDSNMKNVILGALQAVVRESEGHYEEAPRSYRAAEFPISSSDFENGDVVVNDSAMDDLSAGGGLTADLPATEILSTSLQFYKRHSAEVTGGKPVAFDKHFSRERAKSLPVVFHGLPDLNRPHGMATWDSAPLFVRYFFWRVVLNAVPTIPAWPIPNALSSTHILISSILSDRYLSDSISNAAPFLLFIAVTAIATSAVLLTNGYLARMGAREGESLEKRHRAHEKPTLLTSFSYMFSDGLLMTSAIAVAMASEILFEWHLLNGFLVTSLWGELVIILVMLATVAFLQTFFLDTIGAPRLSLSLSIILKRFLSTSLSFLVAWNCRDAAADVRGNFLTAAHHFCTSSESIFAWVTCQLFMKRLVLREGLVALVFTGFFGFFMAFATALEVNFDWTFLVNVARLLNLASATIVAWIWTHFASICLALWFDLTIGISDRVLPNLVALLSFSFLTILLCCSFATVLAVFEKIGETTAMANLETKARNLPSGDDIRSAILDPVTETPPATERNLASYLRRVKQGIKTQFTQVRRGGINTLWSPSRRYSAPSAATVAAVSAPFLFDVDPNM